MNTPTIMIPVSLTPAEMTALEVATHIYLDLLEVVEPLKPDLTRLEVVSHLLTFRERCQETKGEKQEAIDMLFSMNIPFQELIVVTTAIDAYEYMDTIYCVPELLSQLTSMEVITLTRSFQRRMICSQPKS